MSDDDLRPEYDFNNLGKAVMGKYTQAYTSGSNLVLLDEDVARAFPDEKAVSDALRSLMDLARRQAQLSPER